MLFFEEEMNKKKIKVLLLNPFLTVFEDDPAGINPVLGLAYLAAYLEEKKIPVKIIDIAAEGASMIAKVGKKIRYGLKEKDIIEEIKDYNPEIVGITCQSTLHAKDAYETAGIVKKANPKILVVMGGAHPSAVPSEVLKNKSVDVVVRGEGEITLWEIVKNLSGGRSLEGILGTSVRKERKIIHNSPRPLIKDIDVLSFPARHLLPMEIYFKEVEKGVNYHLRKRMVTMITSRGCPGNCVYCAVKSVWGKVWRGRSPKSVVDEIERIISDYQAGEIHFLDDSISVDQKRLEGICDEIIKRDLKIKWTTPNGIAIWLLNEKLIRKMKKAGCYRLTFGLESGNKEILNNFVGKKYDYNKARQMVSIASKIGLWTVGTFILGFPNETGEQIEDTVKFAISTDLDFAVFYIANPFPGTKMYEIYKNDNLLPPKGAYEIVRGCKSKYFSHPELIDLQQQAFSRFLKSRLGKPWLVARKTGSLDELYYLSKLGVNFLRFYLNQKIIKTEGIAGLWKKSESQRLVKAKRVSKPYFSDRRKLIEEASGK